MDGERAAQIYALGAPHDQSDLVLRDAVRIAQASPDLLGELAFDGGEHSTGNGRRAVRMNAIPATTMSKPTARLIVMVSYTPPIDRWAYGMILIPSVRLLPANWRGVPASACKQIS